MTTWAGLIILIIGLQLFSSRGLVTGAPPPLPTVTANGQSFAGLHSLPKPAILYFWASWCPVCRSMEGTMADLARDNSVVSVAVQSGNAAEVAAYLRKEGLALPALIDGDGSVSKAFGLRGVPALFFLGRDGTIHYSTTGFATAWGIRFRLWLAGL